MSLNPKIVHHSRSNSSPIELHPFLFQFNEHLNRLHSSEVASTSQPLISQKLTGLRNLLDCVDNLFQSIGSLMKGKNQILVEALLDGSLWLIDACGTIRDILVQSREGTQQLRSVLRRKPDEHEIAKEVGLYCSSRKKVKKVIAKCLKDSKIFQRKFKLSSSNKYQDSTSFLCILEESQSISVDVFASLFFYIAGQRISKWSLVPKVVHKQMPSDEDNCSQTNKFEVVDCALYTLIGQKPAKSSDTLEVEKLRCCLEELESVTVDLERSLECLSRLLIKSRVTLLNILQ